MLSFKSQVKSMPETLLTISDGKLESKQPAQAFSANSSSND